MPYYQIINLQGLNNYLELLGAQNISELPKGKGNPPQEDPQIFLGAILMGSPLPALFPLFTSIQNNHSSFFITPNSPSDPINFISFFPNTTSIHQDHHFLSTLTKCPDYWAFNIPVSHDETKMNTLSLIQTILDHGMFMLGKS